MFGKARNAGYSRRALVIKRWGAGFWSDVDHVVGQLAVAEILGRDAIVQWGMDGPYRNGRDESFTLYFEPISKLRTEDLAWHSIWPDYWNVRNHADQLPFAPTGMVDPTFRNYYLSSEKTRLRSPEYALQVMRDRSEEVIVSCLWENPADISAWAPEGSRFKGMSADALRRTVFRERFRLQPAIRRKIERFWGANLAGVSTLAVHARGSDKVVENPNLHEQNARALQMAMAWPGKVFLLTDCESYRMEWAAVLRSRLVTQDCLRTSSKVTPNFLLPGADGYRNGLEILVDTFTASRCDHFIGTYSSNVGKYVVAIGGHSPDRLTFVDCLSPWSQKAT